MKVSMSKFYMGVTGKNGGGREALMAIFKRWGINLPEDAKGDCVDISFMDQAKAAYYREEEERAKNKKVGNNTVGELLAKIKDLTTRVEALENSVFL